jgi:hypothetical protein
MSALSIKRAGYPPAGVKSQTTPRHQLALPGAGSWWARNTASTAAQGVIFDAPVGYTRGSELGLPTGSDSS